MAETGPSAVEANMDAVIAASEAVGKVDNLPKAFSEVKIAAEVIRKIFKIAHPKLRQMSKEPKDTEQKCINYSNTLKTIFQSLEKKCKTTQSKKSWDEVRQWYFNAIQKTKDRRIESLTRSLLESLKSICSHENVDLGDQIKSINVTLRGLTAAGPSLEDSDFNEATSITNTQNIHDSGIGQQNNPYMGKNTFNSGNIHYGQT
ncbi:hypothetical protein E8E14_009305 [Neopestalotiopsis sp. 37M]|nr:hypothetical protein E8E14_009305 [Neopestalotiopsis sp. 37M]